MSGTAVRVLKETLRSRVPIFLTYSLLQLSHHDRLCSVMLPFLTVRGVEVEARDVLVYRTLPYGLKAMGGFVAWLHLPSLRRGQHSRLLANLGR